MKLRLFALSLSLVLTSASYAEAQKKPVSASVQLLEFSSDVSMERLDRSRYKADFYRLANQFEPQMNIGTCGPTSAVIVLNALRASADSRRPIDDSAWPPAMRQGLPDGMKPVEPRYTQRAFFDQHFVRVKPIERFYGKPDEEGKRDPGIQLRQLHEVMVSHGLDIVIRVVADDLPEATIRKELIANLGRAGDYVIVNRGLPRED